jgi:epoxyqueuosine reductase
MRLTRTDRKWIEQTAAELGFDLAGVASVLDPSSPQTSTQAERFAEWVGSGFAGEMEYLKRSDSSGQYVRGDLLRAFPWARSVIVCTVNYNPHAPYSIDAADSRSGWIARYAWSGSPGSTSPSDYHDVLLAQLRILERQLQQRFSLPLQTSCYVDTGPILERGYAVRAGIGWIGKNTCVLHQEQGSWLLLGVIVTSLELEHDAWSAPAADRCGTCTRCIDACPTGALLDPQTSGGPAMDASRCIAYLTIEKKGSIPDDLRPQIGRQVFGCDICQDVCPWNRRAAMPRANLLPVRTELINPTLEWLAEMDGPAFNRAFRGSPLERTTRKRILRNVAIAMGNSGETSFLPQLSLWAAGDDPVLAEAASWAADRLRAVKPDTP